MDLIKLEQIIRESNILSENGFEKFMKGMKYYKTENIIYPSVMERNVNYNKEKAKQILDLMVQHDFIYVKREYICNCCNGFDSFNKIVDEDNIPDYMYCDECGNLVTSYRNVYVVK